MRMKQGSGLRGWVGLGGEGGLGAGFLEAPKKIFGSNKLAPKATEKTVDCPKARKKNGSNLFKRGGSRWGGGGATPDPFNGALG